MTITFVKKILANGEPCQKCADVQRRLDETGQMAQIDHTIIADERDPASEGMVLATKLSVKRAPFFVVESAGEEPTVYTVYFKFVKEVLNGQVSKAGQAEEILRGNPDLDFI